jgi:diguanylate cyclase (GGDEF)-like protein/PAS domain S-box-containing protein
VTAGAIADPARLAAVRDTGLYGSPPEEAFDRFARLLARVVSARTTAVTLAGETAQFLKSAHGLAEPWATAREVPLELSLCTQVVERGETFAVADARTDPRSAGHPGLDALAIGAYLAAPLRAGGHVVGTLCALDGTPHTWSPDDVAALHELAACIEAELALRAALRARDETAERHRAIVETAVDGIVTIDEHGVIASFNGAAERLFGYRAAEVIGRNVGLLMPLAVRDGHDADLRRYREGGESRIVGAGREVVAQRRDGRFSAQLSVGEMTVGGRRMFTGVVHDTSARRRAEQATRAVLAEQAALRRVAEAVAERRETPAIFALAVREAAELLAVEAATMTRFVGEEEAIVVGWQGGEDIVPVPLGTRLPAGDLAVSQLARLSGASARRDVSPRPDDDGTTPPFVEHVAAPILVGSGIWGTLVAGTTRSGGLPPDAEERLERFASLVGLAIDKSVAHDALHLRALQGSVMSRISKLALRGASLDDLFAAAVEALREVLGTDRTGVTQIVGDQLVIRCSTWTGSPRALDLHGTSVSAAAIRADGPVLVGDRQARDHEPLGGALADLHATMAAVVHVGGKPWGTLTGGSRDATSSFDDVDLLFLTAVANVLSAALERMAAEDEIRHQALHDPLTGLANRTLLVDRLAVSLGRAQESGRAVGVLFVDVDHFKTVNDAHGHAAGDALLVAVGERLRAAARPGDTVARLSGDEFVLVADGVADEVAASALAARVAAVLEEPFEIAGKALRATVSIGIALSTADADVHGMLRDADVAMYRAKARGRARSEVFDNTMRKRLVARLRAASELERALDGDELVLHYQPIVSLHDGEVVSVEALVRWQHPANGLIGPEAFVDIAEESGAILALGRHVIRSACRDAARWNQVHDGRPPMGVSVNLSPVQLTDTKLVEHVRENLAAFELAPSQLCLEITETVLLDGDPAQMARLTELRAMGVRFLLDDFGTGYASLAYLQRIELHAIKLDRTFVAGLGVNVRDTAIVTAVTQMARGLGLQLVAEGIETTAQVAGLQALGCPLGQGFLFARPQTIHGIDALLADAPG